MEIKDLIRQKREELKLTYEELGNMVGVGKSTVRKWETGMIENMRRDNIIALAKALNISPALIMGWDIPQENEKIKEVNLSKEETKLLYNFNKLNALGKNEANKRISELTEINKYIVKEVDYPFMVAEEKSSYLEPIAAHDKKGEFTETDYKYDDDLMNDDNIWNN